MKEAYVLWCKLFGCLVMTLACSLGIKSVPHLPLKEIRYNDNMELYYMMARKSNYENEKKGYHYLGILESNGVMNAEM